VSAPDLDALLELTREAAASAGAVAMRHFGAGGKSWYKGPGQVLTEADLEVDTLLHDRLRGAQPDYGWLSEERVDDGSRSRCARA
jgi:myo-inositol-1(or 4)-monophosphatase